MNEIVRGGGIKNEYKWMNDQTFVKSLKEITEELLEFAMNEIVG